MVSPLGNINIWKLIGFGLSKSRAVLSEHDRDA